MNFLISLILVFKVFTLPHLHTDSTDIISCESLSKQFDIDFDIQDSLAVLHYGTDSIKINFTDLSYSGKADGDLKYLRKDTTNVFLDAANAIYMASVLKNSHMYWDGEKHRVIESAYSPSIKSIKTSEKGVKIIHNIDLEPVILKKNDTSLVIQVDYGFYFGPVYKFFDDTNFPVKDIHITYSSKGTLIKANLRKPLDTKITSSTGLFLITFFFKKDTLTDNKKTNETHETTVKNNPIRHKKTVHVIVIDPGHGGKDPGAMLKRGTREKDITLSIAKKLAKKLKKKGFKVILTRDKDVFITLGKRAQIANRAGCDLFVSIHVNYSKGSRAHGVETYFLSEARTKWERSVATFENSVIKYELKNKVDEKNILKWILGDMAQNEFLRESQDLSAFVQESIIKKTKALDRGVKQAGFYVLKGVYAPSILIETGFLTNPKEEKKLKSSRYQSKIVDGIVNGIIKYKNYYARKYGRR